MPTIQFHCLPLEAIELFTLTNEMRGGGSYFRARNNVREKIKVIWPEVFDGGGIPSTDPLFTSRRDVEVSPHEQTALAEGILEFCQRKDTPQEHAPTDARKEQALILAGLLKMRPWVEGKLDKAAPPNEFEGSDEGFKPGEPNA